MLPSPQRLSRTEFTSFVGSKDLQSTFTALGTLKYKKSLISQVSIVISSKVEKRAVYRNRLRRRLYTLFNAYFKASPSANQYILYVSKQAPSFSHPELVKHFYDLLQKTTK